MKFFTLIAIVAAVSVYAKDSDTAYAKDADTAQVIQQPVDSKVDGASEKEPCSSSTTTHAYETTGADAANTSAADSYSYETPSSKAEGDDCAEETAAADSYGASPTSAYADASTADSASSDSTASADSTDTSGNSTAASDPSGTVNAQSSGERVMLNIGALFIASLFVLVAF